MADRLINTKPNPRTEKVLLELDVVMFILIIINILFFIFDWLFTYAFFRHIIEQLSSPFYSYYHTNVHPNFILYDIWFVIIYLIEIVVRWAISIWYKTYPRWYIYPLVHWYDVLGCIPVGAFRWLRLLRLFSIYAHLHRMGVIDLTQTFFYKLGYRFYSIFIEEITDRVFIILLDALKKEITSEFPNDTSLAAEAIKPHQQELSKWLAKRIQTVTGQNYEQHKEELRQKINEMVTGGLQQSEKLKNIARFPFVGKRVVNELSETISDVSFNLVNNIVTNIYSGEGEAGLEAAINSGFDNLVSGEKDEELNRITKDILVRAIERVKNDIRLKIWQHE